MLETTVPCTRIGWRAAKIPRVRQPEPLGNTGEGEELKNITAEEQVEAEFDRF